MCKPVGVVWCGKLKRGVVGLGWVDLTRLGVGLVKV
jgi:hypothetical protein